MIYEFAAKIKDIKNSDMLNADAITKSLSEISKKFEKPLEIRVMFPGDANQVMLVKAQASVSSMLMFHDKERDDAIALFKNYMKELAAVTGGEISTADGFYNNTKTYGRLYT